MKKPTFSTINSHKDILKANLFFITYEKIKRAIRYQNLIKVRKKRTHIK